MKGPGTRRRRPCGRPLGKPAEGVAAARGGALVTVVLGGTLLATVVVATPAPPELPDDATLVAHGAVVGRIVLDVGEVFDPEEPGEDRWLFRLANRLHVRTRERVIRRELLFRSGDPYDPHLLAESERLLRADGIFYDARIRPVAWDGRRVDVEVATRDVWSLTAGFHFRRAGGVNKTQLEIQDFNFLGTGKDLTLNHTSEVDRDSTFARYRDPALLGTRWTLEAIEADNSDGYLHHLDLGRPFYELDARWAARLLVHAEDRVDPLYTLGEIRDRFRHRLKEVTAWWGRSPGLQGGRRVWRSLFGVTLARDRFDPAPRRPLPALQPEDRRLVYPWVGVEMVEDRFVELHDFDQLVRTEDVNLGAHLAGRLGWADTLWGADRAAVVFEAEGGLGCSCGPRRLLFTAGHLSGRLEDGAARNLLLGGDLRLDVRNLGNQLFHVGLEIDVAHRLDGESQLLLGGDSGLRGYPQRFQEGDRRALVSAEQRFYFPWDVLELFHLGAAIFFDAGQAWFAGADRPDELGLLKDLGVGLRVASSRSAQRNILHLDVAYPLDGPPSRRSVQWLITTEESF